MAALRAVVVLIVVFVVAVTPTLVRGAHLTAPGSLTAYAATLASRPLGTSAVSASNQNEENANNQNNNNSNNNGNDNKDNNGNDNFNMNDNNGGNNNNNSNGNDNSDNNGNDNNGNDNHGSSTPPPPRQIVVQTTPACSTPGQEMTFTSDDGRVDVHVFASMSQSVKISIRMPINAASVPPAPGQVVGGLLFQVIAESCSGTPIPTLPAEANLGAHYSDADAAGLNESNFTLARLDSSANQWRQVQKQANDPPNNFVSATVTDMGYYVLYQR